MSISNKLIPTPFADKAGDTYKYSIPATNGTPYPNKATYETGFPAVTMTDIAAGGVPPFGQDLNGVLNDITTAIRYMQAGNYQPYDANFATAIGGYSKNAVVLGSDGVLYQSTIDNNETDPIDGNNWITLNKSVTLSSSVTSDSETTAATSKAVKTVNDKVMPFVNNFVIDSTWNETNVFSPGLLYRNVIRDDGISGSFSKAKNQWVWMVNEKGSLVIGSIPAAKVVYDQRWQNVINNRKLGVTYQNTTGRPIFISVTVSNSNNGVSWGTITATVDGVDIFSAGGGMNVGGIYKGATIAIPIMNGSYYNITSSTSGNINSWAELR